MRWMPVLLMLCSTPGGADAVENRIWLDFNRDGLLGTIASVSEMQVDTVTVILEVHSELPAVMEFAIRTDCVELGFEPEVTIADALGLWLIEGSCNTEILERCGMGLHVCNHSCFACRPNTVGGVFHPNLDLPQGRYAMFKMVASRDYSGLNGIAYLEHIEEFQPTGVESNEIQITWVSPVEVVSWGTVKTWFRSRE